MRLKLLFYRDGQYAAQNDIWCSDRGFFYHCHMCVQIYVVWDCASRGSEETAVHIGTTIHCNNWIAKLAKAYCIHLSRND